MSEDPGAIDGLTARIEALEKQVAALAHHVGAAGIVPDSKPEHDEVIALAKAGKMADAIALYRERTGSGLQDAKLAVDRLASS